MNANLRVEALGSIECRRPARPPAPHPCFHPCLHPRIRRAAERPLPVQLLKKSRIRLRSSGWCRRAHRHTRQVTSTGTPRGFGRIEAQARHAAPRRVVVEVPLAIEVGHQALAASAGLLSPARRCNAASACSRSTPAGSGCRRSRRARRAGAACRSRSRRCPRMRRLETREPGVEGVVGGAGLAVEVFTLQRLVRLEGGAPVLDHALQQRTPPRRHCAAGIARRDSSSSGRLGLEQHLAAQHR